MASSVAFSLMATLGTVSNVIHQTVNLKSAGRNRSKGWRPVVRGVAMNPVDHPHGGVKATLVEALSQNRHEVN